MKQKQELIGLELHGLACLVDHWGRRCRDALEKVDDGYVGNMGAKLIAFRRTVIGGHRGRDNWEFEFVDDEMETIRAMASRFVGKSGAEIDELAGVPFAYEIDSAGQHKPLLRPLPGPKAIMVAMLASINDKNSGLESVVKRVVCFRMGINRDTLKDLLKKKRKRQGPRERRANTETTPAQRLAVSIVYDLRLCPQKDGRETDWLDLLDALQPSSYPPIQLYYLTQNLGMLRPLPERKQFEVCSAPEIQRLCRALRQQGNKGRETVSFRDFVAHL